MLGLFLTSILTMIANAKPTASTSLQSACTCIATSTTKEPTFSSSLDVMAPQFLEVEWQNSLNNFSVEHGVDVSLTTYPAEDLLTQLNNSINMGNAPGAAMVWDGWISSLNASGHIEQLNTTTAYFPVIIDRQILAARVPWGEGWSVVILKNSGQRNLAYELIQDPCIWKRPINELEEYQAFTDVWANRSFIFIWDDRTEFSREIGGIPVEIAIIPSNVKDGNYCELIIARDDRGKTYAQCRVRPVEFMSSLTLSSATMKTIHDSFLASDIMVTRALDDQPGYCTRAEDCIDEKTLECILNPLKCIFDWISGWLSSEQLAQLGLTGVKSHTYQYNHAYAWGSRLRAKKLYEAMKTQDDYKWEGRWGSTAARVENTITYDSGFNWLQGFTLQGTQTLTTIPSGHKYWTSTGRADVITSPRLHYVTESIKNLISYDDAIYFNVPMLDSISGCWEDDEEESQSDLDLMESIDIGWEMEYDANTQILTVTFGAQGEACYGIYEICQICVVGGGEATAQAKLDGTEVHLQFKLEAYVKAECGIHPCAHGEIGGGIEIFLDITYPDVCTCKVTTTIRIGCGGHGDALNIKRESCDVYTIAGPSATYNICTDQNVQNELSNIAEFTSIYGTPVTCEVIETALNDYELPAIPRIQQWEHVDPQISYGHMVEPNINVKVPDFPTLQKNVTWQVKTCELSWVENLTAYAYALWFDPSIIEVYDVYSGKIGNIEIPVSWQKASPGLILIWSTGSEVVTGSGYLAEIRFHNVGAGQTQMALVNGVLQDTDGEEIAADWLDGSVTVISDDDEDGLADEWEVDYFGNLNKGPNDDPDNDGLNNLGEYNAGSDPTSRHTDSDSMPDGWEVINHLNPLVNDASQDPDEDGYSNIIEYLKGTDPQDPFSYPIIEPGVGGLQLPVDKFGLLAPYIGVASAIVIGTVATAICVKRVKRRKQKQ